MEYLVFDRIANCDRYAAMNQRFAAAFAFLKRPDLAELPLGRYEIIPGECWAMIQDPELHPVIGARLEVHRRYIDIQAPLALAEIMGVKLLDAESDVGEFDIERDVGFMTAPFEAVTVQPGEFAIFMPRLGAHAPCCTEGAIARQKKLVIKVLAD